MKSLDARERRMLLVAGPLIALMLLLGHGLPRWKLWIAGKQEAAWTAQMRTGRAALLLAERNEITEALDAARGRFLAVGDLLLSGRSAATAGASLLRAVSRSLTGAGMVTGGLQATSDTVVGRHFVRVGVRGEATGDIRGVMGFLQAVESERPLLGFRELAVDQSDPSGAPDRFESLRIRFLITGLARRMEDRR